MYKRQIIAQKEPKQSISKMVDENELHMQREF